MTVLNAEEPENSEILWDLIRVLRLRKRDPQTIRSKIQTMLKLGNNGVLNWPIAKAFGKQESTPKHLRHWGRIGINRKQLHSNISVHSFSPETFLRQKPKRAGFAAFIRNL
ncbi:hypothetical protein AJ87_24255 [Rhizobium yanglingense]|nr:hypothetical protein AJ87_24255 [Rhizobium yanglingense]